MTLREQCLFLIEEVGLKPATIAHKIHRDPSTIQKWLSGERKISKSVENEIRIFLKKVQKIWAQINFGEDD